MIARPRSGTTLLMDLLSQIPGVCARGEVLGSGRLRPAAFMANLAATADRPVLACKLLSYQLLYLQPVKRPVAFLRTLEAQGYRFVHLRRDTRAQTRSLVRAGTSKLYHLGPKNQGRKTGPVRIDPDRVAARARWNAAFLDYEDRLMAGFDHLRLDYETALRDPEEHQRTIDAVCRFLGHPTAPVAARLERVGAVQTIENAQEVDAALDRALVGTGATGDPAAPR